MLRTGYSKKYMLNNIVIRMFQIFGYWIVLQPSLRIRNFGNNSQIINYRGFYLKSVLQCFFVNQVHYVTDCLSSSPTSVSTIYHKIQNIYFPSSVHPHQPTSPRIKASNVSNVTGSEKYVKREIKNAHACVYVYEFILQYRHSRSSQLCQC